MLKLILAVALAPSVVSADITLGPGTQLTYRGSVEARVEQPGKGQKAFDLALWVLQKTDAGAEVFWLVDEQGRGEFPWPERFGRAALDARLRTAGPGPALLYDRGDGRTAVQVALPFFVPEQPLAAGADFAEGKFEFHVDKATKAADRPAWQISMRDPFGPKRLMAVDQRNPLVLKMTDRLTMGRGEEYQLKLEFVSAEPLEPQPLASLNKAIERLTALRGKLNLPAGSQEIDWKSEQLDVLRAQLPGVIEAAAGTPLARVVTAAERDTQLQSGRNDAVADLAAKQTGRAVEPFTSKGLDDEALSQDGLLGHVTVLHFWDYRDEPLKEPYGQVGYLDFIYHRRKPNGLQVYGVAVDGRLGEEKTRGEATRSVKKLKAFMNLSYPILLDSGGLLKQFGDPRPLGANLPLFVVIGPDQKIIHYHVGTYDVHQDQGLKQLDEVVLKALSK